MKVELNFENRISGNYKIFTILPALQFIVDNQFEKDFGDIKGFKSYEIAIEFICFYLSVELIIENK